MNQDDAMDKKCLSDSELWNDPVLWKELEYQAEEGTIDLFSLPPFSYIYFSKLSLLRKAKEEGTLTESFAEGVKSCLLMDYQQQIEKEQKHEENIRLQNERYRQQLQEANEAYERAKAVYIEYQNAIRTAGILTSDIEKSRSVYEIMDIACKIIGLLTGDSSFHGRQLQKFPREDKNKENQKSQTEV